MEHPHFYLMLYEFRSQYLHNNKKIARRLPQQSYTLVYDHELDKRLRTKSYQLTFSQDEMDLTTFLTHQNST